MESLTDPVTPGAELFPDAQGFIANYASELGLSPVVGNSPVCFTGSRELLESLGDVVCWSDNVDHCISYLNKELVMLGLPALYKDDGSGDGVEHGFDLLALVNGTCELLNLYQATLSKLGDMEAEDLRRAGELDYLRMRHSKLKHQVEACEKEIAAVQSKEQQLQSKNKQLITTLKEEKDEVTKLLNALTDQKNQHVHEIRKKDQELLRLKEKMNQLVTEKKDKRGTIDILNAPPRADGKRGTWKTGKSLNRKEEELYRIQLANQEQREQALVQENEELKMLLNGVGQDVEQLLGIDAQGTQQSCPYKTLQEQWRSLINRMKMLGWQALDTVGSQMPEENGQDPVISETDHDKEIIKLKGDIEESRVQIAQLKRCLQEQLTFTTSELPAHLEGSYFLEEQQQLQEEREMFEEQKQAFEKERENFTEAAIRLGWERKQFEEEKAQFLKQEFLCSLPKLNKMDATRRFSVPVCVTEWQEHEDLPKLRRSLKPVGTHYPRPKVIFTPRRASRELFRRRQLTFNPATPTMNRQAILLAENWLPSPPLFSQNKESHKETACQIETSAKNDPPGEHLDQFLNNNI